MVTIDDEPRDLVMSYDDDSSTNVFVFKDAVVEYLANLYFLQIWGALFQHFFQTSKQK
jgi:hypothetical protein